MKVLLWGGWVSGEIILSPDLEDEEGPELMAVVGFSLEMGVYHPLDLREVEGAGLCDPVFFESPLKIGVLLSGDDPDVPKGFFKYRFIK